MHGLIPHPYESRTFPSDTDSVADARAFVAGALEGLDRALLIDARLAVSELFTNGVEHGNGETIEVAVHVSDDAVELSVTSRIESGSTSPIAQHPVGVVEPVSGRTGRGLRIIAAMSREVRTAVVGDALTVVSVIAIPN